MRFAKEGLPFIGGALGLLFAFAALGTTISGWWWVVTVLWFPIALWVPYFFRDPIRTGERGPHLAVCPADGKVVVVDDVHEPAFIRGSARRIAIFMNVFNVHVNRYPTDGTVAYREYRPGRFLNATLDKASEFNERTTLGINSPGGPILIHQIAGLVARRIVTDHDPGTDVKQGDRLGLIRFGSRVELLLPHPVEVRVSVGDIVKAGETVIGEWAQ